MEGKKRRKSGYFKGGDLRDWECRRNKRWKSGGVGGLKGCREINGVRSFSGFSKARMTGALSAGWARKLDKKGSPCD